MLLPTLLLPLVAPIPLKDSPGNYVLDIKDGILKNVLSINDNVFELDLSSLGLHSIEKNALDKLSNLKSLNLANNSFESLPDLLFSNLSELEYLSLAENQLSTMNYLFVGLNKLKTLNISYNPVAYLERSHLYSLTKSARVLTEGNKFRRISTGVFTNVFQEILPVIQDLTAQVDAKQKTTNQNDPMALELKEPTIRSEWLRSTKEIKEDPKLQLCMPNGIVTSLEALKEGETVAKNCEEVHVEGKGRKLDLSSSDIKGFHEGWYKLHSLPIYTLDLSYNEITEITKETLNELPEDLIYVDLSGNRIERIWSNVIKNKYLKVLDFKDNLIDSVEDGALQNTNLSTLALNGNQLHNLSFVSTLPQTLTELILGSNEIVSIDDNAFSNLPHLFYLNVANNKIRKLQNNVFRGLDTLQVLILTRNNLMEIESQAFANLKQLTTLYLYRNSLEKLEKGIFSTLINLTDLNLALNKLQTITRETFADLPENLCHLYLDYNKISSIEEGSFVNVPQFTLSLSWNKISDILPGTFNLPNLQDLNLSDNVLTTMNGDSFEGLPQLKRLSVKSNKIERIPKGSCKNLRNLQRLDISWNPFEKLENGAFYGLNLEKGTYLHIHYNKLKELHGGMFDNI